jgi:hypothetical protein
MKRVHFDSFAAVGPGLESTPSPAWPISQGELHDQALAVRPAEAKPGKEEEVAAFLQAGLRMRGRKPPPRSGSRCGWRRARSPCSNAFHDQQGVDNHLGGPIAKALMAKADELFAQPPSIQRVEVLGLKNDGST